MIHTIVLDIGNVLAHFGWKEFFIARKYDEVTCQRLFKATVQNKLWSEWDRGSRDEKELIELFIKQEPDLEAELRDYFGQLLSMVREYDYSKDFVKQLKENGYRVYLLSNYGRRHFENDSRSFSFMPYIDGKIISYSINRIKPEPEIYQALIDKYDINPSEAVFLDDVEENLAGARPFGFHTILFKDYSQAQEELRKLGVRI